MMTNTTVCLFTREVTDEHPLVCDHEDGRFSIRLVKGDTVVWIEGTPEELAAFGEYVSEHAARLTR